MRRGPANDCPAYPKHMSKGESLILGLMSGTSHDGVDAALVGFGGDRPHLVRHHYSKCPSGLRNRINQAPSYDAAKIARLDYDLGEYFARAAIDAIEASGLPQSKVLAIASHGQTIVHLPPARGSQGATMQLGSAAVIAARTGIAVVSDFRAADIAADGQGAPLVPFADRVLFSHMAPCAVHNIGGISNLTLVPRGGMERMLAFDTGPGNSLMDEAMKRLKNKPYDLDGNLARRGRPDEKMIQKLLGMPYFKKRPPKSTGREMFGPELLDSILSQTGNNADDILSTLAHFTARSIGLAYRNFALKHFPMKLAIFSGGGTRNSYLMELIKNELDPIEVRISDEFEVPSAAREAMSFAILGNETINGRPSNVPSATGATRQAILGSITPAPIK